MMKKLRLVALALAALIVLAGLAQRLIGQRPRPMPDGAAAVDAAAREILAAKCNDCHDHTRPVPFYGNLPVMGALVRKDIRDGVRHFDIADKSHLGPDATAEEKAADPVPFAWMNKLRHTLADGSMPPIQYKLMHWGSALNDSEKAILDAWIRDVQGAWLAQWGITEGIGADVHPIPDALPHHPIKAAVGERLYNDKRLSKDNTISCATCHVIEKGGTDNLPFSVGVGGLKGGVNAPTVLNAVFNMRQFWDGRAAHLAAQAGGPPLNPVEMASANWEEIIAKLEPDLALRAMFLAVYPEGYSEATICDAIAEFEKRLITPNSRFDKYLKGDKGALTAHELRGYELFTANRCAACHAGPAMGGLSFEYADLKGDYFAGRALTDGDAGLAAFSKNPKDDKRFKVPTLRNVALTAPYMHDASKAQLADAVASMLTYQVGKKKPRDEEVQSITLFLKTLNGELFGTLLK